MPKTLTEKQVNTLEEVATSQRGLYIQAYCGRSYGNGKRCLGVVLEKGSTDIMNFALELRAWDKSLALMLADGLCRFDSLGRRAVIMYWPYISVEGTRLADSDDEEGE